jgi:cytochrome o ubiquinol oxidase subunit 2
MITPVLRYIVFAAMLGSLCGCGQTVLSPIGPVGAAERTILLDALAIMLAIVVPTILATLAFAWWFRAGNTRARYLPTWQYSGQLELLVWSVPALIVLFLGGIGWIGSHDLDPARPLTDNSGRAPKPLEVEVVSLDWKWLFIYPERQIASVNRLVVPTGVPLHLRLTSATVMNVFFVPRLGSEIYSMYGMATQLNLQADQPGVFPGRSANFSGDGFSNMDFNLEAVSATQFDSWVAATRGGGATLDEAGYRKLLRQHMDMQPYTYHSVEAGLFNRIVSMQLPAGEGPQTGTPSPSIKPTRKP